MRGNEMLEEKKFRKLGTRYQLFHDNKCFEVMKHIGWNTVILQVDEMNGQRKPIQLEEDCRLWIDGEYEKAVHRDPKFPYFLCFGHDSNTKTWKILTLYIQRHFKFKPILEVSCLDN
jgi:hypothetical protein